MKRSLVRRSARLALTLPAGLLAGALWLRGQSPDDSAAAASAKARAYQLYDAKKLPEAAAAFESYVEKNTTDTRALFDYASLLIQMKRPADAARRLEQLHQAQPRHEPAYFRLGATYLELGRVADAQRVFSELQRSGNADMAAAAGEASRKLQLDQARVDQERARTERLAAEKRAFELARAGKHNEVVVAIAELEKTGELSRALRLQRVYALAALHENERALAELDKFTPAPPVPAELGLVRADLLAQLGRRGEAEKTWSGIATQHPGTAEAVEAARRLQERTLPEAEDHIYDLVRRREHREALAAIDALGQQGALSWPMEMQRVYSLAALGESDHALARAEQLAATHPESSDLALLRADLLIQRQQWTQAGQVLRQTRRQDPDSPAGRAAADRLRVLPPMANLDKWYWGEAYASGDYFGRYGTVVGSGFVRQGAYVPEARWLQPYVEYRFGADTRSGTGTRETIIADNAVGLYGGARLQVLPTEYLFLYGQGGINKDLLDRREQGDWALDYQAGLYGYKSWGPGVKFHQGLATRSADRDGRGAPEAAAEGAGWHWRGDWFVDTGANFSYYHRYRSWIGYAQAHEGFRMAQLGQHVAVDVYAVEDVAWDVRGNFFDNFADLGPGARVIWVPHANWQVTLSADWLEGFYFGRDDRGTRGNVSGRYEGAHVALAVGARW